MEQETDLETCERWAREMQERIAKLREDGEAGTGYAVEVAAQARRLAWKLELHDHVHGYELYGALSHEECPLVDGVMRPDLGVASGSGRAFEIAATRERLIEYDLAEPDVQTREDIHHVAKRRYEKECKRKKRQPAEPDEALSTIEHGNVVLRNREGELDRYWYAYDPVKHFVLQDAAA